MMEDYHRVKTQLQIEKDKLTERLIDILVKNDISPYKAWFNWNKHNTIVWGDCTIPRKVISDLESEFGETSCIYIIKGSNELFIKFKG